MITGSMIFSAVILVFALLIIMKVTRMRHRLLAVILMIIVIFLYFSFNFALDGHDIDLTTAKGVTKTFGIYFSWLNSAFGNIQGITSRVVENTSNETFWEK